MDRAKWINIAQGVSLGLSGISVALLLYCARLPEYGDGAIGTVMVFVAALLLYVLALIIAAPLAIRAFVRKTSIAESKWLYGAMTAPLLVWIGTIVLSGAPL